MKKAVLWSLLLLCGIAYGANIWVRGVNTGWWNGWEFGTKVYLTQPTLPDSTIVVTGTSNDMCMQAVVDNTKQKFHLNYQHKSQDGFQCEERWCLHEGHPITSVRVWGSAIWDGVHHSVSVTEFTAGNGIQCGNDEAPVLFSEDELKAPKREGPPANEGVSF